MTAEEWALGASVFFSGLSAGLLGMLSTIMRPMLAAMDGRGFRTFMEAFLRYADHGLGKLYNLAWAIVPVLGPIVALVLLWDDPGSTSFILTAIGVGIVLVGIWLVSNAWKTPTYNVILSWDPEALPAHWKAVRRRYFTINWIQLATTWAAFLHSGVYTVGTLIPAFAKHTSRPPYSPTARATAPRKLLANHTERTLACRVTMPAAPARPPSGDAKAELPGASVVLYH